MGITRKIKRSGDSSISLVANAASGRGGVNSSGRGMRLMSSADTSTHHVQGKTSDIDSREGASWDVSASTIRDYRPTAAADQDLIQVSRSGETLQVAALVESLPEDQLAEFHECFETFDQDGSGTVDKHELSHILGSFGMKLTREELEEMIAEVDADASGDVDFPEFCAFMTWQMYSCGEEQQLRSIFECLDVDSVGSLAKSHLRYVIAHLVPSLSTEDIDRMLDSMAGDRIDFRQFYNMFQEGLPNVIDAQDTKMAMRAEAHYQYCKDALQD
mmetsp:Transcript_34161/g.65263  ORF Transcript_34161/g.65263 Transcript_34161/m.65263 type:complete len:273 (+) Transcript_34161:347-1165(+)|eukprot:CAMPEP_0114257328 /NCGR_PEP_ID=MMETSP0058-20121206/18665_1 /TAXON_ID=36894 /ORGANISM="Pyramimonas parkeae, CCMP726" /LENGTH=272 /DNA_ID=CAMNT_0001372029 /DNA_START=322 /DNA_END=1140 /DNA_ORIENTATION=-